MHMRFRLAPRSRVYLCVN